ncbi:hypothetical protein [Rahnella laticis]|uniref:hypothetical protein n=1 Tax=Rahnella laticis TaxID=2787622 RepID=UPI0018A2629D|nr:hypothetical protein [Rahnella laticis]MBF7993690.1 hypothetical protein [Rahnella laticis]
MQLISSRTVLALILASSYCMLLSACSATKLHAGNNSTGIIATDIPENIANVQSANDSRLNMCTHELEALKTLDEGKFQQYNTELTNLTLSSRQYLAVKEGLGSDVNEIIMSKYQFQLSRLCFNVKYSLTSALIEQVGRDVKP